MADQSQHFIEALTERESDVLFAMAEGMSNQEIANHLHIALATVKWYNSQIYSKLDVSNRDEAVEKARSLGLLETDDSTKPDIANNLPQENTPFIGRNTELRELHDLLNQSDTRLITILAQGGMGKTRLALQLAKHNLSNFSDGVFLVQLAPVEQESSVPAALASVLGLQHYDNSVDMQDNVIKYVQSQQMLLILDNFEHVLGASALVSAILQVSPGVKIITTSRERLNLQGEIVYMLSGMASRDNEEAIELFIQSTQRIRPDYEINNHDLPHIREICRLVDGMPLGIELAAGWMDTLSAEDVGREITENISILETAIRDVPERHRSIQATFEYTWQSLSESEQATMMSLSLFRGGFNQEAAREVALADVRRLKHLLNKSLLYRDPFGRYSIHELLRQFCFDKLIATGDYDTVMDAFMQYIAEFARSKAEPLKNFDGNAYRAIRNEWDNLALAWMKMLIYERYDLLEMTYMSLWKFSSLQGHSYECVALFEPALEQLRPLIDDAAKQYKLYAKLLAHYADLLMGIETADKAKRYMDEAITMLETLDPSKVLLYCYSNRIYLSGHQSSYAEIKAIANKMIEIASAMNAHPYVLDAYSALWMQDEFVKDETSYQQSLEYCYQLWERYHRDYTDAQLSLASPGIVRLMSRLGKIDEAIKILHRQLEICERAEWLYGISGIRGQLMIFAFREGRIQEYRNHVVAVLRWHQWHGRDWQMLGCLAGVNGDALYYAGEYERCVEICSFVINHPIVVDMQKNEAQAILERAKQEIDEKHFHSAWERGQQGTIKDRYEEAMAYWSQ